MKQHCAESENLDALAATAQAEREGKLQTISLDELEAECGLGD